MAPSDQLTFFPRDFWAAREAFRSGLSLVQRYYPNARLARYPLPDAPDLAIEWITAEPADPRRLLIVTSGLHGAEGYVGAAVLRLFLAEFLPRLDVQTSALVLAHPLNPWGMQQRRRVNRGNVDLNRNFFLLGDPQAFSPAVNPDYDRLNTLLNPTRPVRRVTAESALFGLGVARALAAVGVAGLRAGALLGQYRHPQGIYYGGAAPQPETLWVSAFLREQFARYPQVVLLDMHTGYGPRTQMSLVHSVREAASGGDLAQRLDYPRVVKTTPDEFYAICGDMVDFAYQLATAEFPALRFYGAAFEFGTLGDSTAAGLRSLHALVLENQAAQHGCDPRAQTAVQERFAALFEPTAEEWRLTALRDARRAFAGILRAEQFLPA